MLNLKKKGGEEYFLSLKPFKYILKLNVLLQN